MKPHSKSQAQPNIQILPHNRRLEAGLLSAIVADYQGRIIEQALELEPDDFFIPLHRKIFEAMLELKETGILIESTSLYQVLSKKQKLSQNDVSFLALLESPAGVYDLVCLSGDATRQIQRLRELGEERFLIIETQKLEIALKDSEITVQQFDARLDAIRNRKRNAHETFSVIALSKKIHENLVVLEKKTTGQDVETEGFRTGLVDLDNVLRGLRFGHLDIIAGRPGDGKTSLACGIALHAAYAENIPTLFISIEMAGNIIANKFLAMEAKVPQDKLETGREMYEADWDKLSITHAKLSKPGLYIEDKASAFGEIVSVIKQAVTSLSVRFVVIDYLQIIQSSQLKSRTRDEEIGVITSGLMRLAKELNINILLLSQLNREVDKRKNQVPRLSDLRDSGTIEQNAWRIMFIYHRESNSRHETEQHTEIVIAKNRIGETKHVPVYFNKEFTKFQNVAKW